MARKSLIDKDELIHRTEQEMNASYGVHRKKVYKWTEHNQWTSEELETWKREKANMYCRMRNENKAKMARLFTKTFNNGYIEECLKKYGICLNSMSRAFFMDNAAPILKSYVESIVLPALEKECGIEGVKIRGKRITGNTYNILDWERAKIIKNNK